MEKESAISKACRLLGGQAALAKAIGISPQAVHKWLTNGKPPAERVLQIEKAVKGKVSRYELRPDVFGSRLRRTQEPTGAAAA